MFPESSETILVLAPEIHEPFIEGVQKSAWAVATAFSKSGVPVHIVTQCTYGQKLVSDDPAIGISYFLSGSPGRARKILSWMIAPWRVALLLWQRRIKRVLAFSLDTPYLLVLACILVFFPKVSVSVIIFSVRELEGRAGKFLRIFHPDLNRVFVMSQYASRRLRLLGLDPEKLTCAPFFFTKNMDGRRPVAEPYARDMKQIGYMGSLAAEAGVWTFVRAAQLLPQYHFVLAVRAFTPAGEKKMIAPLAQLTALRLPNVEVRRNLPDPVAFLRSLAAVVICPEQETHAMAVPLVMLEAFLAKTPVIMSRLNVFEEFTDAGLACPFIGSEELVAVITELLSKDHVHALSLVDRAQQFVSSLPSATDAARLYDSLI